MKNLIITLVLFSTSIAFAQSKFIDLATNVDESEFIKKSASVIFPSAKNKNTFHIEGNVKEIGIGFYTVCLLDDVNVKCIHEINNSYKNAHTYVPKLINPKNITGAGHTFCSIDSEYLKCWDDEERKVYVPEDLHNPTSVSVAANHICAVVDEGARCWNSYGKELAIPKELNFIKTIASSIISCGISGNIVKCWGVSANNTAENFNELNLNFKDPQKILVTVGQVCVLDGNWFCWKNQIQPDLVTYKMKAMDSYSDPLTPYLWNVKDEKGMQFIERNLGHIYDVDSFQSAMSGFIYRNENKIPNFRFKNLKYFTSSDNKYCAVDDDGLHCFKTWSEKYDNSSRRQLFIPTGVKDFVSMNFTDENQVTCVETKTTYRCWNYILTEKKEQYDYSRSYYIVNLQEQSFLKDSKIETVTTGTVHNCALADGAVNCFTRYYPRYKDLFKLPFVNPKNLTGRCVLDEGSVKCWDINIYEPTKSAIKSVNIDQSSYFYSEKAIPLKYASDILANVEDTPDNVETLAYIREIFLTKLLYGMNTETSNTILSNSRFLQELALELDKDIKIKASERNSTQLRFVLDLISSTLNSSKYLLSNSSKILVEKLLVLYAGVLSEDEINVDQAKSLISAVLSETRLMNEMNSSYRLIGIKAFYEWTNIYVTTGAVE
jgi:hypothetical protein